MVMMQVGQHGHDRRPERRAGRHGSRGRAPHTPPTARAAVAEDPHPGDHRPQRRQVDMVVGVAQRLSFGIDRRAAVRTGLRTAVDRPCRIRHQRPRDAGTFPLAARLLRAWRPVALLAARRRSARIGRRLRRLTQLRLERRHPLQQRQNQLRPSLRMSAATDRCESWIC